MEQMLKSDYAMTITEIERALIFTCCKRKRKAKV